MPKPHVGAASGDAYVIPELTDVRDIEVAFAGFADSLPQTAKAFKTERILADHAAVPTVLYVADSPTPITLTLPIGHLDGDTVKVFQTSAGAVTLNPNNQPIQGPVTTTGQFSALTAVWVGAEGRWVVAPFSFSGVRPIESDGGRIVDLNGRRYHVYDVAGDWWFYSHADMLVDVWMIGMGGEGADAGALPGEGGGAGQILVDVRSVESMLSVNVRVGGPGAVDSEFEALTARGGANATVDTPMTDEAAVRLTGGLETVLSLLGYLNDVGGSGKDDGGPLVPIRFGQGGAGAHLMKATIPRTSTTSTINHPGTPGSDGYWVDQSYGARAYECNCRDVIINGDTMSCAHHITHSQACGNGQCCIPSSGCTVCAGPGRCPGGWWVAPGGGHCQTSVRQCDTCYACDNGGSLSGTTCVKGYQVPGTPGTPGWTETVVTWNPCPTGYKVGADTTKCVDERSSGKGDPGDGLVVVHYPYVKPGVPPVTDPQEPVIPPPTQPPAATVNAATGGTVEDIVNYLGSGETWRVHRFDDVGVFDFEVTAAPLPFSALLIGGGGNGDNGGHPGQGGQVTATKNATIPVGKYKVTVPGAGGSASLGSLLTAAGGASQGGAAGGGSQSDIDGTVRGYAGNGGKIWWNHCCPSAEDAPGPGGGTSLHGSGAGTYFGGGGAGMQHTAANGTQTGFRGRVVIAYKIK